MKGSRSSQRFRRKEEKMIRFGIVLLALMSLVGCSGQKIDPKVAVTYDASVGIAGEQLQNAAIMVMVARHEYTDHLGGPTIESERMYRDAQARFRHIVESNRLSNYTRFIIASDSLSRVVIDYPGTRVVRETR